MEAQFFVAPFPLEGTSHSNQQRERDFQSLVPRVEVLVR
jgi:hypothetical protein